MLSLPVEPENTHKKVSTRALGVLNGHWKGRIHNWHLKNCGIVRRNEKSNMSLHEQARKSNVEKDVNPEWFHQKITHIKHH